jgi:hypothetical protein
MSTADDRPGTDEEAAYRPTSQRVRAEVGGVLERAFRREGGQEPDEEDFTALLSLAEEAEARAEAAESHAREAERAAAEAGERYGRSANPEDLAEVQYFEAEKVAYQREAESLRLEAERLRAHFPG